MTPSSTLAEAIAVRTPVVYLFSIMLAKAGIQRRRQGDWIPTSARMTSDVSVGP
jgi:hypothetical protein